MDEPFLHKDCWNLAEGAKATGPWAMPRLLRTARWDADAVRDDLRGYVVEPLGPGGVLIRRYLATGEENPMVGGRGADSETPPKGRGAAPDGR
ncbi:hypothetical protein GCM10017673_11100 [Streptosporangium violaceochromogenes]|nr:hypothetical protein GCM10017673_11100 [Streptosporangium violaceochromogenes]